jgi:hypothetical protein
MFSSLPSTDLSYSPLSYPSLPFPFVSFPSLSHLNRPPPDFLDCDRLNKRDMDLARLQLLDAKMQHDQLSAAEVDYTALRVICII